METAASFPKPPFRSGLGFEGLAFRGVRGGFLGPGAHLALGDPGRLPAAVAQIIELGATDDAAALHLDGFDVRRVDREHAFHAFAEGDLADGEALVDAAALAGDAD